MGCAEFVMLAGEFAMGTTSAVNMALVRDLDVDLPSEGGPQVYLRFVGGDQLELDGDDAICVLSWLRDHAGRHPHLSLDLDQAIWRGRGDG